MRRLAAELFREVGVRPLENTREAAMVERFYCSRLYMGCDPLNYIFTAYCKPLYGLCLWNHTATVKSIAFKTFDMAYSSSLKRILGVPSLSSNHVTAAILNQLMFRHYISLLKIKFLKRILKSKLCLFRINRIAVNSGHLGTDVHNCMKEYSVTIDDDNDVLESRLKWVQNHEERRRVCIYYNV